MLILEVKYPLLDFISLCYLDDHNNLVEKVSGNRLPLLHWQIRHHNPLFDLSLEPDTILDLRPLHEHQIFGHWPWP
jgi:hypothetical protein